MTPSIGSPFGSIITAYIKGVGPSSTGVDLVTSSGASICASVSVTTYGEVKCTTKAATLALS